MSEPIPSTLPRMAINAPSPPEEPPGDSVLCAARWSANKAATFKSFSNIARVHGQAKDVVEAFADPVEMLALANESDGATCIKVWGMFVRT